MFVIVPSSFEDQVDVLLDIFKENRKKTVRRWIERYNSRYKYGREKYFEAIYLEVVEKFKKLFIPINLPKDTVTFLDDGYKAFNIPENLLESSKMIFYYLFVLDTIPENEEDAEDEDYDFNSKMNYDDLIILINKIQSLF
jgi:hypothetical protein